MPERAPQKVPKGAETLTMILHKTPDILGDLGHRRQASGRGPALIGFAAETQDVIARAIEKREKKHVDLIVANDVARTDAGFDVDTNAVTIISADGVESLPLQSKSAAAGEIIVSNACSVDRDQLKAHLQFAAELASRAELRSRLEPPAGCPSTPRR